MKKALNYRTFQFIVIGSSLVISVWYFISCGNNLDTLNSKPEAFSIYSIETGDGEVTINWGTSKYADDYSLSYGTSSGVYNQSTGPISTNAYTVSGLANGTIYFFKVFASNSLGSYESEELSIEVGSLLPSSFAGNIASIGDSQVTLEWSNSTNADNYIVSYGTTSGEYTSEVSDAANSPLVITGLTNGTTYFFNVVAKNSLGERTIDAEVSATPTVSVPGAFSISSVTAGGNSADLVWESSSNASSYTVKYGTASGSYPITASISATSPYTISGLLNSTTYYFQVTAVNSNGSTNAAAEKSVTTSAKAPGSFAITSSATTGNDSVTLIWDSSSDATSYTVKYGTTSGSYPTTASTSATSPYTLSGLSSGTTYYIMVTALNGGLSTNATSEVSATPMVSTPGNFTITSATGGQASVTLIWAASTNATSYTVKYGTTSGNYPTTASSSATSPLSVSGLVNGTTYYFMVTAVNSSGSTNATREVSAIPAAPAPFTITSATSTDTTITLVWAASANATSYTVKYGTSTGSYPNTASTNATSPFVISGLTSRVTYYLMVTAVNSVGATNATSEISSQALWSSQAYIKAPNVGNADLFGASIGLSSDTLVVGVQYEDSNQTTITNGSTASSDNSSPSSGAVYVFRKTGASWAQEAYLKTPNDSSNDRFGVSVGIASDTIVVGAKNESSNQTTITNGTSASTDNSLSASGAAYVFKRTGTSWAQEAYIKAPNPGSNDIFGEDVAISGDTIVVGSRSEDSNQTTITNGTTASTNNSSSESGAVYVFKRSGTTWAQEAYIKAPNANAGDSFGYSVAISGDTIVVGANGEDSNQTTITNGTSASTDNSALSAGAVYVFKRTGTNWAQEAYIKAPNAEAGDSFGYSVAISGDTIVVGANGEDSLQDSVTNGTTASASNIASSSGAAYVFKRTGTTWAQEAFIKAPNVDVSDGFGKSVAISGDSILVSADKEDSNQTTVTVNATSNNNASDSGAVYLYKRTGTSWAFAAFFKSPSSESDDNFSEPAITSDTIAVGVSGEDSSQATITNGSTASADNSASASGAVFIFN